MIAENQIHKNPGIGKKFWAISGGGIPLKSTGTEPKFLSQDCIAILNTAEAAAQVELSILYGSQPPVGKYKIKVDSKRLRKIRFNDLIDPFPIPLGKPYGCFLSSNVPVVVQFSRMDTGQNENAGFTTMAFPVDNDIKRTMKEG